MNIGIHAGFYSDTKQKFSHFRLGGDLFYYYIKDMYHNLYISLSNNTSIDKLKFDNGTNLKIGVGIPIYAYFKKSQIVAESLMGTELLYIGWCK